MKLDGRRQSANVEDRRGLSGSSKAGMGIGGLIIAALLTWLLGGNPMNVLSNASDINILGDQSATEAYQPTAQEEQLAEFSKIILAGTEDVWTKIFREQYNMAYEPPKMVLFTSSVQTGCGGATSSVGPFYCSSDKSLYIDLSFFAQMKQQLGADGEFAYAYVIAHEVGHHVENLLGILTQAHQAMSRSNKATANKISVRIELLADFYAGIWGYYDNKMFGSIEAGDIENAIRCSQVIGDDYLQKKAQGYTVPDSFTHGTSKQREKWLTIGLNTGDLSKADLILNGKDSDL